MVFEFQCTNQFLQLISFTFRSRINHSLISPFVNFSPLSVSIGHSSHGKRAGCDFFFVVLTRQRREKDRGPKREAKERVGDRRGGGRQFSQVSRHLRAISRLSFRDKVHSARNGRENGPLMSATVTGDGAPFGIGASRS